MAPIWFDKQLATWNLGMVVFSHVQGNTFVFCPILEIKFLKLVIITKKFWSNIFSA